MIKVSKLMIEKVRLDICNIISSIYKAFSFPSLKGLDMEFNRLILIVNLESSFFFIHEFCSGSFSLMCPFFFYKKRNREIEFLAGPEWDKTSTMVPARSLLLLVNCGVTGDPFQKSFAMAIFFALGRCHLGYPDSQ